MLTRNQKWGIVGMVWGGGVVLFRLSGCAPEPHNASYAAGQNGGLNFGFIMFAIGLYYFRKG